MYGKAFTALQLINIVVHSIFTLLWQIGLSILIGWLCVEKWSAPSWLYVPLILLGVASGLIGMVRFILSASASVERIEREREKKYAQNKSNTPDQNRTNGDNNE